MAVKWHGEQGTNTQACYRHALLVSIYFNFVFSRPWWGKYCVLMCEVFFECLQANANMN